MPTIMVWDNKQVEALVEKWKDYVPAHNKRAGVVAIILENQANLFRSSQLPDDLEETFGDNWKDKIYHAIAKAWMECPLATMISIQPMSQPVDAISFYSQTISATPGPTSPSSPAIPTVSLNIQTVNVAATCRRLGIRLYPGNYALVDDLFNSVLLATIREILGVMHGVAASMGNTMDTTYTRFKDDLYRSSHLIHKTTMRGPANHVIANAQTLKIFAPKGDDEWDTEHTGTGTVKKVGVLDKKMHVYLDSLFPDGEAMLWYMGASMLDAPVVYSPFYYGFAPMDGRHNYALQLRHSLHMAHPGHIRIVKVNVLERLAQID